MAHSICTLLYFYLFVLTEGRRYRCRSQKPFERVRDGDTTKNRCNRSILESRTDLSKIKTNDE